MQNIMRDLQSGRWMAVKAVLFVVMGVMAGGMLLMESPHLRTAALLGVMVWAFARAYYFCFYVLEKYIDPEFRFAGLWSAARHLLRQGRMASRRE